MSRLSTLRNSRLSLPPVSLTGLLSGYERWSDASTWGGTMPLPGDSITIVPGKKIVIDCAADITNIVLNGHLTFAPDRTTSLRARSIDVGGTLWAGSTGARHTAKIDLALQGAEVGRTARFLFYESASRSGAGNGNITRLGTLASAVAADTITITFSSATAFAVNSSISGSLGAGTVGTLFNSGSKVQFTLVAGSTAWANTSTITMLSKQQGFKNDGTAKSITIQPGGVVAMYGADVGTRRQRVDAHITANDATLTMANALTWPLGTKCAVGSTDWFGTARGASELRTIRATAVGAAITFNQGLANPKWGRLQYMTDSGWSLTAGTLTNAKAIAEPTWGNLPKIMDQRAPVLNLTSNIVIRSEADAALTSSGFGGHVMIRATAANAVVFDQVEFRDMGQAGAIGRYPIHWHAVSYNMPQGVDSPTDGTFLFAVTGHVVRNCAFRHSRNRAIVVHMTHGVTVQGNAVYDTLGHAIFLEDGAEMGNSIVDNAVGMVRSPTTANALVMSDDPAYLNAASSGIWISNPENIVTGNWTFDCVGAGWWCAFGPQCFGLATAVALTPTYRAMTNISSNVSWGNLMQGCNNQGRPHDNIGNVNTYDVVRFAGALRYHPRAGGVVGGADVVGFDFDGHQNFKNNGSNYVNDVGFPSYKAQLSSDPGLQCFEGATDANGGALASFGDGCLIWGVSLNNATPHSAIGAPREAQGVATYHGTLEFRNCIFGGFVYTTGATDSEYSQRGGGEFALQDLYIGGVSEAFTHSSKIQHISSNGSWFSKGTANGAILTGMARVIRDPQGVFVTAGRYWIANETFTSSGANITATVYNGADNNGLETDTRYFGIGEFWTDWSTQYNFQDPMSVERLTTALVSIATRTYGPTISSFRHFEVQNGGVYRLTFTGATTIPTTRMECQLSSAWLITDLVTVALPWSGSVTPTTVEHKTTSQTRTMTAVASIAAVIADTTGTAFFRETGANKIWLKLRADLAGLDSESHGNVAYVSNIRVLA